MTRFSTFLTMGGLLFAPAVFAQQESQPTKVQAYAVQVQSSDDGPAMAAPLIIQTTQDDGNGVRSNMRIVAASGDGPMFSFMGDSGNMFALGGGDDFSMLQNPSVQKDLELVDDQMAQIRAIQQEFNGRIKDAIGDISKGGFGPERAKNLSTVIKGMKQEQQEKINKILLPHQQDRISQMSNTLKVKVL